MKNIDPTIYIDNYDWYHTGTGNINNGMPVLATYNSSTNIGTNGGSRFIPMGQGFFVKANVNTAGSPVLTMNENVKVAGQQTSFLRESAPDNLIRATLISSNQLRDETVIYFSEKASEEFDNYDAFKRFNRHGYMNLSSLSPVKDNYAINAIPFPDRQKRIPLEIIDVKTGKYSLTFTEFSSLPSSMRIQLEDKYENTITDIRESSSYSFNVNSKDKGTYGSDRFSLIFGGEELHPEKRIKVYPVPVTGILTIEAEGSESASGEIFNMVGLTIGTLTFTNGEKGQIAQYDFSKENSGVYFVRVKQDNRVSVTRIVKD